MRVSSATRLLIAWVAVPCFSTEILNVPFKSQVPPGQWKGANPTRNCGQTSVLMVTAFYRAGRVTVEDIKAADDYLYQRFGDPVRGYSGNYTSGSMNDRLPALAAHLGFPNAVERTGVTLDDLRQSLVDGVPPIVGVWTKMIIDPTKTTSVPHWMVLVGMTDNSVIVNDPGSGNGDANAYTLTKFLAAWNDQGRTALYIPKPTPSVSSPPNLSARMFFDGTGDSSLALATFGPPSIDLQGRLLVQSLHWLSPCPSGYCGSRLNAISPAGARLWQSPFPSYISGSSVIGGSAVLVGPNDRVHVRGGASVHVFEPTGTSAAGWPAYVPHSSSFFPVDFAVDRVSGVVFTRGNTVGAYNPDGSNKWNSGINGTMVQGPGRFIYTVTVQNNWLTGLTLWVTGQSPTTGSQFCSASAGSGGFTSIVGGPEGVFIGDTTGRLLAADVDCQSRVLFTAAGVNNVTPLAVAHRTVFATESPRGSGSPDQDRLVAVSTNGTFLWRQTEIIPGGVAGVQQGLLYAFGRLVSDPAASKIFVLDAATGALRTSFNPGPYCTQCSVVISATGRIYLTDLSSTRIYRLD